MLKGNASVHVGSGSNCEELTQGTHFRVGPRPRGNALRLSAAKPLRAASGQIAGYVASQWCIAGAETLCAGCLRGPHIGTCSRLRQVCRGSCSRWQTGILRTASLKVKSLSLLHPASTAIRACRLPLLKHRSSYQLFLRRYFSWQPPQSFLPISPNAALKESRSFTFASAALESLPNLASLALKSSMFFQISGLAL